MAVISTHTNSVFHLMCFETLVFFLDEDAASCSVSQVKTLSPHRRYRAAFQHRCAQRSCSSSGAQHQLRRGVSNTDPSNCCAALREAEQPALGGARAAAEFLPSTHAASLLQGSGCSATPLGFIFSSAFPSDSQEAFGKTGTSDCAQDN